MKAAPGVKRIETADRLAAEASGWAGAPLFEDAPSPMQTLAWIRAAAETLVGDGKLEIIVVEGATGPAALAPLIRRRGKPDTLEFLGARELFEPSDFLFRDAAALAALLDEIGQSGAVLDLQRVPAASPTIAALERRFHAAAIMRTGDAGACPRITIPPGTEDIAVLLSGHLRSDLRRARRRAAAMGDVSHEIAAPRDTAGFLPLYRLALDVEAAGWKGAAGSAVAKNAAQSAFFQRFGELASESGLLRLAFLRIDGAPAAMQYAVEWRGAFWLFKVGYDEQFRACSPGQLLMGHTLAHAVQCGFRAYEFLGAEGAWTQRWTREAADARRFTVYPRDPGGIAALGRDVLRAQFEKAGALIARSGERRRAEKVRP